MNNNLNYIKKDKSTSLATKDLINLGLYNLLMILLMGVGVGICAAFFSVFFAGEIYFAIFTTVGTGFFAAPAFTLIFQKINKKYAVLISSFVLSLFLLISGHVAISFVTQMLGGLIAEFFYRRNNEYLSYLFFTMGGIGAILPMYFMKNNYITHMLERGFSQEKVNFVMNSASLQMFWIVIISTVIFTLIGTYIGRSIYFRNFEKAGI